MAIFRLEAKIISRNGGHSSTVGAAAYQTGKCATSAAAYRAGEEMTDERTGQTFDYSNKRDVLGAEIILPKGAPAWMGDRSRLWNAVEKIEKRRDSQLARDFIISLPHELTDPQRRALLKEFVGKHLTDRGYVADVAFHAPPKHDNLNWHAHVMVPMRKVNGDGFARKKERPEGNPKAAWRDELAMFREDWAAHVNRHLEAAGIEARVDHRSNEAQGIDREPEPKLGPLAAKIEAEGRDSHAGDDLRAVRARNADRNRLKVELAGVTAEIIDLQAERMKRLATQQDEVAPEVYAKRRDEVQDHVRIVQSQANQPSDEARMRETLTREAQQQADDAHKHEQDIKRQQDAAAANGDVTDPSLRYAQALGSNHMTRNPYDLLANAALTEYGMFAAQQQKLKEEAAKQEDPTKRQIIELQARIEGTGYMWITSQRLGGIADVISGRENSANGNAYRDAAAHWQKRGEELQAERAALIEQQREDARDHSRETRAQQAQGTDASRAADEAKREGNSNNQAQTAPQQDNQQQDTQRATAPRDEQRPQSPAEARAQAVSDVLRSNDRVAEERAAEGRHANEFQFRSGDVDRQRQARAARSPEESRDSGAELAAKIRAMEQSAHRQEAASPNHPSKETQPQETRTESPSPESRDIGAELAAQIRASEQSGRQQESTARDASKNTGGDRSANTGTGNDGNSGNAAGGQGRASGSGGKGGR